MTESAKKINPDVAAQTGIGPTAVVAIEQYFPDHQQIIHDDLSGKILPAGYRAFLVLMRLPFLRNWMVKATEKQLPGVWAAMTCRKRYIDEQLLAAAGGTHPIQAIVNLGAGYDTRLYRLRPLAGLAAWEVDQPVNIDAKQANLQKALGQIPASVRLVSTNFLEDEMGTVLKDHGFLNDQLTFFIWEAVSQYLSEAAVRRTFDFLSQARPGSRLAFTYVLKGFIEGRQIAGLEKFYRQMVIKENAWHFGFDPEQVADFLGEYGWRLIEDLDYEALTDRYVKPTGRDLPSTHIERIVLAEKA